MSQENVEIVRALYAAWRRGDYDTALEFFDSQVEWFGPPDVSNSALGVVTRASDGR